LHIFFNSNFGNFGGINPIITTLATPVIEEWTTNVRVNVADFVAKLDSLGIPGNSAAVNDDDDDKNDVVVTSPADDDTTKKKTRKKRKSSRKSEEIDEKATAEPASKGTFVSHFLGRIAVLQRNAATD